MELETLYQRYCIRLKHALFLSCLTVAVVTSAVLLVTTCILQVVQSKAQDMASGAGQSSGVGRFKLGNSSGLSIPGAIRDKN
jgi:hypothetical protein